MDVTLVVVIAVVGGVMVIALLLVAAFVIHRKRQINKQEKKYRQEIRGECIPVSSFLEGGHDNPAFTDTPARPVIGSIPRVRSAVDVCGFRSSCASYSLPRDNRPCVNPKGSKTSYWTDSRPFSPYYSAPETVCDSRQCEDGKEVPRRPRWSSPSRQCEDSKEVPRCSRWSSPSRKCEDGKEVPRCSRWSSPTDDKNDPYSLERDGHNVNRVQTGVLRRIDP
ncbi:uncharacterized protein [Cherax quadricarinatus]